MGSLSSTQHEQPNHYPEFFAQANPGTLFLEIKKLTMVAGYSNSFLKAASIKLAIGKISTQINIAPHFDQSNSFQIDKQVQLQVQSLYKTKQLILHAQIINKSSFLGLHHAKAELNLSETLTKNIKKGEALMKIDKQGKHIGQLQLSMKYILTPYKYLSFKINKAFTIHISDAQKQSSWQIYCKIKIGEMSLQTSPKKESATEVPNWNDQVMTFKVYEGIQTGHIQVYQIHNEKITLMGKIQFDIDVVSHDFQQHQYNEKIESALKNKNLHCVGSVNFQVLASKNRQFAFNEPMSALLPKAEKSRFSNKEKISEEKDLWSSTNQNGFVIFRKRESSIVTREQDLEKPEQQIKRQREKIKRKLLAPLPLKNIKSQQVYLNNNPEC